MESFQRKKCCHCRKLFHPDPRNAKRQEYCSEWGSDHAKYLIIRKRISKNSRFFGS